MRKHIISFSELEASFARMSEKELRIMRSRAYAVFMRAGMDMRGLNIKEHVECSKVEMEGFARSYTTGVVGQFDMGRMTDADAEWLDKDDKPQFLAKGEDMGHLKFPEQPDVWGANERPSKRQIEAMVYAIDPCDRAPTGGVVPDDEYDAIVSDDFDAEFFGDDEAAKWLKAHSAKGSEAQRLELDGGMSVFAANYL